MNPNAILVLKSDSYVRICIIYGHTFKQHRSWSLFARTRMDLFWFWYQWLLDNIFLVDLYELLLFLLPPKNLPLDLFYAKIML